MSLWETIANALAYARDKTLGALFDAVADAKAKRDGAAFSIALIALSAKMAKADGVVTDDEIAAFREFFDYPPEEERNVRMVYQLAQQDVAGFDHYAARVARIYAEEKIVLEDVLDCLFHVALADGVAHPREMELLELAAKTFGLSPSCYRRIKAAHFGVNHDDPYLILGVEPEIADAELKARYRELMRRHHPDALVARGVPPTLVKIAEERTASLNAAYERILQERAAN